MAQVLRNKGKNEPTVEPVFHQQSGQCSGKHGDDKDWFIDWFIDKSLGRCMQGKEKADSVLRFQVNQCRNGCKKTVEKQNSHNECHLRLSGAYAIMRSSACHGSLLWLIVPRRMELCFVSTWMDR